MAAHGARSCRPTSIPTNSKLDSMSLVDLPPSASSKWTSENAENILSVRYVRAPFGPEMPGETVDSAYINLLVHSNSAPTRDRTDPDRSRPTSDLLRLNDHSPRPDHDGDRENAAVTDRAYSDRAYSTSSNTGTATTRARPCMHAADSAIGIDTVTRPTTITSGTGMTGTDTVVTASAITTSASGVGTWSAPKAITTKPRLRPTMAASTMPDKLIKEYKKIFEVIEPFNASRADAVFLSKRRQRLAAERTKTKKLKRDLLSGPLLPELGVNAADKDDRTDDNDVEEDENSGERELFVEDGAELPDEEDVALPMAVLKRDIDICFTAIEEAKLKMMDKENLDKYSKEYIYQTISRYDAMRRFMSDVQKLLIMLSSYDVVTMHSLDEGFFTQLFINFGWIFTIDFRLVSSFERLVIGGNEVASQPDIVLMESALSRLVVTVVEVKKDVEMISDHGHDTRKRKLSGTSDVGPCDCDRDDIAYLPSNLRGQHACQLVCALPLTNAKNRMCMLGMIVQETKVRLTCLLMTSEHLKSLKHHNYNPANYSAKIFYTRAYDMLNADDREHLINIMTTLSSFQ